MLDLFQTIYQPSFEHLFSFTAWPCPLKRWEVLFADAIGRSLTARWLAQLVQRRTVVRKDEGSSPDRTNTQGLKIIEENVLPLQWYIICKWLEVLVFSDKNASSLHWLAGDVIKPIHFSQRVGHEVPGVMAWPRSRVGASHRVNPAHCAFPAFPLGWSSPRKIDYDIMRLENAY